MPEDQQTVDASWGTATAPVIHDVFTEASGQDAMSGRAFTYATREGLVAGATMSVMADIDRPVERVWPRFKDFNQWQNADAHYYSAVVGDLSPGDSFTLTLGTGDEYPPFPYRIIRVIPNYLIVFDMPVPEAGTAEVGLGMIPAGFMSFGLDQYEQTTRIAIFMEHSSVMALDSEAVAMTVEDAVAPWREMLIDGQRKWREVFLPTLRAVVEADLTA